MNYQKLTPGEVLNRQADDIAKIENFNRLEKENAELKRLIRWCHSRFKQYEPSAACRDEDIWCCVERDFGGTPEIAAIEKIVRETGEYDRK